MTEESIEVTAGSAAASLRKPSLLATLLFDRQTIVTLLIVAAAILIVPPFLDALWLRVLISSRFSHRRHRHRRSLRGSAWFLRPDGLVGVGGWVTLRMWARPACRNPYSSRRSRGVGMLSVAGMRTRGLSAHHADVGGFRSSLPERNS
jgi:hypothetical protein